MTCTVSDPPPPAPATDAAVHAEGLAKTYPNGTEAVRGLDLEIHRGEVLALLGPNGAGKSTTVGMLTTAVRPTVGRALVGGVDVARHPAAARRLIGVVPQRSTLDRSLTVRQNLVFHGRYFGLRTGRARIEADRLLAETELDAAADRQVDSLSGGMSQRLMIARAVLHHPEVLFLDEPTTGLDPQGRLAVHSLVRRQRAEGRTVVLITHDMVEAETTADRVAIVDHGRLIALGAPAALRAAAGVGTTVTVTADAAPDVLATALRDRVPGLRALHPRADGVALTVDAAGPVVPAVGTAAAAAGLTVRDLTVEEPSLGTVFLHLTGKDLRDR